MRKSIKTLLWVFVLLLLLTASALYFFPDRFPPSFSPVSKALKEAVETWKGWVDPQPSAPDKTYRVIRVVDGDTLAVRIKGEDVFVRLIGIDAPESVSWDETKNTPEGEAASAWLKSHIAGKRVSLEYDEQLIDRYGRSLAYVYVDGVLLEDDILRAGMAVTLVMEPNTKYTKHFAAVEREAREAGAGFWGTGFFR